jgi:hypothetical protein
MRIFLLVLAAAVLSVASVFLADFFLGEDSHIPQGIGDQ